MTPKRTSTRATPELFIQTQLLHTASAPKCYRWVLNGFVRFAGQDGKTGALDTVRLWLADRIAVWPVDQLVKRTRLVAHFLDWMADQGAISNNPIAELKKEYGQAKTAPVVRALLKSDFRAALEVLRPVPRFGSFLGPVMLEHVAVLKTVGYRYTTQEGRLLRLDRFLQGRPDLAGNSVTTLIREWAKTRPGPQQALECQLTGRTLARALSKIGPAAEHMPWDRRILKEALRRHRQPYLFSEAEVSCLLTTALSLPSRRSPLRPKTAHMMLVLAYCAGLRIGVIAHLNVEDFDVTEGTIEIRQTKFFKSRRLPLSGSVASALKSYLVARKQAGAPANADSALFWHSGASARYSGNLARRLLVGILRQAGLKPATGRVGPRIHDLRHAFVVNRMALWYREGINPQSRLPYLATYLGHKDINSTLVYLTITQELLQHACERFRVRGARVLATSAGRNV